MTDSPAEAARRNHAALLLEVLVFGVLLVHGAGRFVHALRPAPPAPSRAPPPLAVDLAWDPAERLELLPGVGRVRAEAIVAERLRGGPYRTLGDLLRVHGIGEETVRRIRAAKEVRPQVNGVERGERGVR